MAMVSTQCALMRLTELVADARAVVIGQDEPRGIGGDVANVAGLVVEDAPTAPGRVDGSLTRLERDGLV